MTAIKIPLNFDQSAAIDALLNAVRFLVDHVQRESDWDIHVQRLFASVEQSVARGEASKESLDLLRALFTDIPTRDNVKD